MGFKEENVNNLRHILATKYRCMLNNALVAGIFLAFLLVGLACRRKVQPPEDASVWKKVHLDFKRLDADGLSGPPGGKVAVNYEFCIPAQEKNWKEVQKIDPSARKQGGSQGRIGCRDDQWLVIGSTHQPRYQRVLYELAALTCVERIEETFWE